MQSAQASAVTFPYGASGLVVWFLRLMATVPTDRDNLLKEALPVVGEGEEEAEARTYLEHMTGIPFWEANDLHPLNNGREIFPAMLKAIRDARESVLFLTFIYWEGKIAKAFADALSEKASHGVKVRVLLDAFGAQQIDRALVRQMEASGVEVAWFRPLSWRIWNADNRTHRKVLVCDGRVGFTGGVGIAEEWEGDARGPGEWREIHFKVTGPAVAGLSGAFWENWLEVRSRDMPEAEPVHFPQPAGSIPIQVIRSSSENGGSDAAILLLSLFKLARERLDIVTPYLVLDELFLDLICEKSRSGILVRFLIPGPYIDKRFERIEAERYFEPLLEAGVEIYRYQKTMIHTKLILVDSHLSCIGSMNLNRRSMRKDEEILMVLDDTSMTASLRQSMEEDLENSQRVESCSQIRNSPLRRLYRGLLGAFRREL